MIKQTKIVCTLGPSSTTKEQIEQLALEGMNITRINMSHGDKQQYTNMIEIVRAVNKKLDVPLGIMLDTKGAEIRTGERATPLAITKGDVIRFCPPQTADLYPEDTCIEVSYDAFGEDCKETDQILVDNGELSFTIDSIEADGSVFATAKQDGRIGSRRHINLFGALVDLPTITEKDWEDIAFAVEQHVDFLALSFIRTAQDVLDVKQYLSKQGSSMFIIAKIETKQAVENIHEIIDVSDAVMVARGDLGAEIPYEQLPAIQDRIVTICSDEKKPVIIATQMLESMIEHPMPTRAEITDVAHAATTRADATMLSGETASGNHPALVVTAMSKILQYTEIGMLHSKIGLRRLHEQDQLDTISAKICTEAYKKRADAIVLDCNDIDKLLAISKQRPELPVVQYCSDATLVQYASILYGIHSIVHSGSDKTSLKAKVNSIAQLTNTMSALQVHWDAEEPTYSVL